MRVIIDGDTIAVATAATTEEADNPYIACSRAQVMIEGILDACNATEYEVWLSGKNNFRYDVYPEYKANRRGTTRPRWEQAVKLYLSESFGALWSEKGEADDVCGIRCTSLGADSCILAHIDKDLNQIAGWHYNWPIWRNRDEVRAANKYYIPPDQADYFFWYQLLTGDPTDNIKGAAGIGKVKATDILNGLTTNEEMYEAVKPYFSCDEELEMNASCVYIWRKENDNWKKSLLPQLLDSQTDGLLDDYKDLS